MIVIADKKDAKTLTEIALKSKAFWGYSNEQLKSWTDDLTVSKKMIQQLIIFKFISDHKIVGFYILNQPKEKTIELEFLFVLPEYIGKGIGKQLMHHVFQKSIALNCNEINLVADPNAVSFYQSKGFVNIDKKESSIPNRFLIIMRKILE